MTALRLIIENHPSWHSPRPPQAASAQDGASLPVSSQSIYTVLGRRNAQWHTIVPRVDGMDIALNAMDSANRSALFDRLVVASAASIAGQPAGRWETCLCALPHHQLAPQAPPSFSDMLARAERQHARQPHNPALSSPSTNRYPVPARTRNRLEALLPLTALILTALWSQTPAILVGAGVVCGFEALYQAGRLKRLIPPDQIEAIHMARFYLYALCAGLTALPLTAALLLRIFTG